MYVDDVLGHTGDWNEHMKVLRDFFERVQKANLSLKPSKCKVGFAEVDFLKHTLQKDTIRPQRETVGHILDTERPKTKKACRSLLGMINFYRRYIPNCAEIIAPQPQRKFGLWQLSTATDGHRAGQWVTISDVVWTAYQTNGADLQPGSEEPYTVHWTIDDCRQLELNTHWGLQMETGECVGDVVGAS